MTTSDVHPSLTGWTSALAIFGIAASLRQLRNMTNKGEIYTSTFYAGQSDSSLASARRVLPLVLRLVNPNSVVDVGCGTGSWLAACRELGVNRTVGVEGPWVARADLRDQGIELISTDLEAPIRLNERFDLAISLEVAEHLPESRAAGFVRDITELSPAVLFGAAIPNQGGGFNHINERWQSYWVSLFASYGFTAFDAIRPAVWSERDIQVHYRQNPFLFVHQSHVARYAEKLDHQSGFPTDIVHPEVFLEVVRELERPLTIREALHATMDLPGAIGRSLKKRLGKLG